VIPAAEQPAAAAASPSPVPDAVSPTPTPPQSSASAGAAAGPGAAGVVAPPATSETAGAGAPAAVGTTGTVAGTAPAGSSSSSASGYRLSGADMSTWIGKRVQIVGSLVPAAASTGAFRSSIGASPAGASGTPALPEFHVVSVSPATGDCSNR